MNWAAEILRNPASGSTTRVSKSNSPNKKQKKGPIVLPLGVLAKEKMKETPDSKARDSPSLASAAAVLDRPLHALGFEFVVISPEKVAGRLKVTETCCQPFKVLHGGVSALIAEALASLGGYVASGFRRVVGVQLSSNHLKPALLGEEVEAEARPIQVGRTIQVWEVQIRRINPSTSGEKVLLSTSRITLAYYRPASEDRKDFEEAMKKYSKL